tara:strand:- start:1463 stop:2146 length:684 start_codon:yes stop_codon:yes gene_type:complete
MKKFYRITLLIIALIFLSTYNPNKFDLIIENNNSFFKIKKIVILNNSIIEQNIIYKRLNTLYEKNIFFIRKSEIEESLKEINFLEKIEVKKKYPSTIIIKIFETKPLAVLIKDKTKYLIDSSSNLVNFDKSMDFIELPSIFGDDAEISFVEFLKKLEGNKFPIKKIKNFYFFKIERWDLQLVDSRIIKFPNNLDDSIIKKSIELLYREDFQNYNIIDLRVDGKIIVE